MNTLKYFTLVILQLLSIVRQANTAEEKHRLRGRRGIPNSPTKIRCKLYWRYEKTEDGEQESLDCEIIHEETLYRLPLLGLSDEWLDLHKDEIISGESILETRQLDIDSDLGFIHVRDDWGFNWHTFLGFEQHQIVQPDHQEKNRNDHDRRLVSRSQGKKRTVIVHIRAKDASTPLSPYELSNHVFGTYGNRDSVRSQMKGCSYDQFDIVPSNARGVVNGVYQMNLDLWVRGKNQGVVQNAALNHLRDRFGSDLSRTFDHVMICVPEGVGKFIAYAWTNDFLTVFHGDWCNSFSTVIHELGHNIGLLHAGEGTCATCNYADESGMMGYVFPATNGPKMCFNGAQSWQLGWYRSKSVTLNPLQQPWDGELEGVDDYRKSSFSTSAAKSPQLILQLDARRQNVAYYVMFNRKSGINEGTKYGIDQVLVTRQAKYNPGQTTLVAKLSAAGDRYVLRNYNKSGEHVTIRLNQILKRTQNNGSSWTAAVTVDSSIAPLRKLTPAPTPSPTTPPPTLPPQVSPTDDSSLALYDVSSMSMDCKNMMSQSKCVQNGRYCKWNKGRDVCLNRIRRFRYPGNHHVRSGNPRDKFNSFSQD